MTSRDFTAYYETLAVEHLDQALALEADRMTNLVLNEEEFRKEVAVVREERRLRTEDSPSGRVYEQFNAVAWRASPYRDPVIGWMSDLRAMELDDLADWYKRWYVPNNAILVVVGDVEADAVRALAIKHFGSIPRGELPPLKVPTEPPQLGETRVEVSVPAKQPFVMLGYKTPSFTSAEETWEPYALYLLSNVLDGGSSARFSRELVRGSGVAASAGADYDLYQRLPGMLMLSGTPSEGRTVTEVEDALRHAIAKLREELVDAEELKRIVTQVVASKVYAADSQFAQAMEIGLLESVGIDWRIIDNEVASLKAVTPEQVRTVAQRYLKDANLTVATLRPLPLPSAETTVSESPSNGGDSNDS